MDSLKTAKLKPGKEEKEKKERHKDQMEKIDTS